MTKIRGGKTYRLSEIPPGPIHPSAPLPCLKVAYASKVEAEEVRTRWKQGASYKCRLCQMWHLTKNPNFKRII